MSIQVKDKYDVAIIGCGITGAACAYELSKYDLNIVILEKENDVSMGATKANSAIIHAGYDPEEGSLMARLNVRGAQLAKELCQKLDVPYKQCGALVVAFSEKERAVLDTLKARGEANGVEGLRIVEREELAVMEPQIGDDAIAALDVPTSGIVSPWEYCLALAETAVKNGAVLQRNAKATAIKKDESGFIIDISSDVVSEKEPVSGQIKAAYIVNASGCSSEIIHDMVCAHAFEIHPAKGQYYLMDKEECCKAKRTIFQCPNELGKGVLVSPTVHGNLIVGPDSVVSEGEDKSTTAAQLDYIRAASAKSIKGINYGNSIRNFAGVRARSDRGDFIVEEAKDCEGFFDAAGICSPGLSAAPAIAEEIANLIKNRIKARGGELKEKTDFVCERHRIRFKDLSSEDKAELIKENPAYGRVICRCETVTEGEIRQSFNTPIPPVSIDGVKRRVGAGLGRCQGGFCGPKVLDIISEELNIEKTTVVKEDAKSFVLTGKIGE